MSLRFGTDGVRARAPEDLTPDYVRRLAHAAASEFGAPTLLVGRDPRESGPLLLEALVDGCAAASVDVIDLGVVPTPAVAWMSRSLGAPAAMISASHNPWSDNGIKLFSPGGRKLSDDQQDTIQRRLDAEDGSTIASGHRMNPRTASIAPYVDAVVATVGVNALAGCTVAVDTAHGAASGTAAEIFERLGATVYAIGDAPNGRNINDGVGSTHPEAVSQLTVENRADVGFAFDGDADRVIGCGGDGSEIDGDRLIAMSALDRRDRAQLVDDTVVITVMTNLGFRRAMTSAGIRVHETGVGDRHVLEALDAHGWSLGGEQSGHIIHRDLATTGDGVLSAVQVLDACVRRGVAPGEWAASVMTRFPQVLENVRLDRRPDGLIEAIATDIADVERELGDDGRVLIRPSGTEPLIRVMVEASEQTMAQRSADRLVAAVVAAAGNLV